jgi:hypothetical protein
MKQLHVISPRSCAFWIARRCRAVAARNLSPQTGLRQFIDAAMARSRRAVVLPRRHGIAKIIWI